MSPRVIEFIGLPGAGKTTLAQNVIEELTVCGYRCFGHSTLARPEAIEKRSGGIVSKLRTAWQFTLSCVAHRRLAVHAAAYTARVKPLSLVSLRRLFVLLFRFGTLKDLMDGGYDLLVLDQGPIQNLWSIATTGEEPKSQEHLERVLRDVLEEVAPLVVLVDVRCDVASERIAARPTMRSRFDKMPPSEAEAMLSTYRNVFARIVDLADGFADTGFLRVDGHDPVPENVSLIVPFIARAGRTHGD